MKTVYILARNHMDPSWRRGWEDHFSYDGHVIRPYSELEEKQIRRWMDVVEGSQCKYSIEQSISVKKFLANNPDLQERFTRLVQEGRIELLGGGETVIDYNMVYGESIIRNHMYSKKYYEEIFGRVPKYAACPDTFGLSAQLPQIFRQFGYDAITMYSRVFQNPKKFWKGLNGDLVVLETARGYDGVMGDVIKYGVCTACKGEGCPHCGQTGMDYSYHRFSYEDVADRVLQRLADSDKESVIVLITSEETLDPVDLIERMEAAAERHHFTVRYVTCEELTEMNHSDLLEAVRDGRVEEADIDPRVEGNPMATGCFVSRIELKKQNRELEDLLLSAEKFAAFAANKKGYYPGKKLEVLWNKMAFLQFHDCITASHTDSSYEELLRICRQIRLGAAEIYDEALHTLEKDITIEEKKGWTPVVVFNPLNWEVSQVPLTALVRTALTEEEEVTGIEMIDTHGNPVTVTQVQPERNRGDISLWAHFIGKLPPMGYAVYYWRPAEALPVSAINVKTIENEYYEIQVGRLGIKAVIDKRLGRRILEDGAGMLQLSDDVGHPWGRGAPVYYRERVDKPFFQEHVTTRHHTQSVSVLQGPGYRQILIKGTYSCPERKVHSIAWTQTVTLYDGISRIFYRTEVDWNADSARLSARLPLPFVPMNEQAWYEIPFGMLEREKIQSSGQLGIEDEWPAINWFGAWNREEDWSVIVCNKGLPGSRIFRNEMQISLLRSPEHWLCGFDCDGAKDEGHHVFEYSVTSCSGKPAMANPTRAGLELNTAFMSTPGAVKAAALPMSYTYLSNTADNVFITAVKREEDGDNIVVRMYEAYGRAAEDTLSAEVTESDPMEILEKPVESMQFKPFEIKTYKIK